MTTFRTIVNQLIENSIAQSDLKRIQSSISLQDYIGRVSELQTKRLILLEELKTNSEPKHFIHIPGVNDSEYVSYLKSLI